MFDWCDQRNVERLITYNGTWSEGRHLSKRGETPKTNDAVSTQTDTEYGIPSEDNKSNSMILSLASAPPRLDTESRRWSKSQTIIRVKRHRISRLDIGSRIFDTDSWKQSQIINPILGFSVWLRLQPVEQEPDNNSSKKTQSQQIRHRIKDIRHRFVEAKPDNKSESTILSLASAPARGGNARQ
jgi:hypothetical protein